MQNAVRKAVLKTAVLTVVVVLAVEMVAFEIFVRTHRFTATDQPTALEAAIAAHARQVSVPAEWRNRQNPQPAPKTWQAAREHWNLHCAQCHGEDGSGKTTFGTRMYPPVPDLRRPATQRKRDGELHYTISRGVRLSGMPAFEGADSDQEIWELVSYIRQLAKEPPPAATPAIKRARPTPNSNPGGEAQDGHTHEPGHEHSH